MRLLRKKILVYLAALMLGLASLSACGGGGGEEDQPQNEGQQEAQDNGDKMAKVELSLVPGNAWKCYAEGLLVRRKGRE